jgi:hypothetical protein
MTTTINGRPVNRLLGFIIGVGALLLGLGIVAVVLLLVPPLVGVVLTFSVGLICAVLIGVGLGLVLLGLLLPVVLAGTSLLALLSLPFRWLRRRP